MQQAAPSRLMLSNLSVSSPLPPGMSVGKEISLKAGEKKICLVVFIVREINGK